MSVSIFIGGWVEFRSNRTQQQASKKKTSWFISPFNIKICRYKLMSSFCVCVECVFRCAFHLFAKRILFDNKGNKREINWENCWSAHIYIIFVRYCLFLFLSFSLSSWFQKYQFSFIWPNDADNDANYDTEIARLCTEMCRTQVRNKKNHNENNQNNNNNWQRM